MLLPAPQQRTAVAIFNKGIARSWLSYYSTVFVTTQHHIYNKLTQINYFILNNLQVEIYGTSTLEVIGDPMMGNDVRG